jgi:hypothetical protein
MIVTRILAILAAMFLVGAFTLAVSLPLALPLGEVLARLDATSLLATQNFLRAHADWCWQWLLGPLLIHPVWFLPASTGVMLGGAAVHLAIQGEAERRRREN